MNLWCSLATKPLTTMSDRVTITCTDIQQSFPDIPSDLKWPTPFTPPPPQIWNSVKIKKLWSDIENQNWISCVTLTFIKWPWSRIMKQLYRQQAFTSHKNNTIYYCNMWTDRLVGAFILKKGIKPTTVVYLKTKVLCT